MSYLSYSSNIFTPHNIVRFYYTLAGHDNDTLVGSILYLYRSAITFRYFTRVYFSATRLSTACLCFYVYFTIKVSLPFYFTCALISIISPQMSFRARIYLRFFIFATYFILFRERQKAAYRFADAITHFWHSFAIFMILEFLTSVFRICGRISAHSRLMRSL